MAVLFNAVTLILIGGDEGAKIVYINNYTFSEDTFNKIYYLS